MDARIVRKRWTAEEDARLAYLVAICLQAATIERDLRRTHESVKHRRTLLGLQRDMRRTHEGCAFIAEPGETFVEVQENHGVGYYVSDFGRVVSMREENPGVVLRPWIDRDGYSQYNLVVPTGSQKRIAGHMLVALHFLPDRPGGLGCAHWDGKPSNNRVDNLRWATQKENCADKIRHGTVQRGAAHWTQLKKRA